jgi:hypothetical protein
VTGFEPLRLSRVGGIARVGDDLGGIAWSVAPVLLSASGAGGR